MRFQAKITLITLGILVATLLLNSVLSLASFEKIYVDSLVSTYEIAGRNLKRKIEQSLRFGKPLDKFRGMDLLLQEVTRKNPAISYLAVATPDGNILYHTDEERVGDQIGYGIPPFDENEQVYSRLLYGSYVTFLPLFNRENQLVGVINFSFPRELIYSRLRRMAANNIKVLWILMLFTSVGLIIFLALLVVRPIKKEVLDISDMLVWPGDIRDTENRYTGSSGKTGSASVPDALFLDHNGSPRLRSKIKYIDIQKIRSELDRLGYYVYHFVSHSLDVIREIVTLEASQADFFQARQELEALSGEIQQALEGPDVSKQERETLQYLSLEVRNLSEKIFLIGHIFDKQQQTRRDGL